MNRQAVVDEAQRLLHLDLQALRHQFVVEYWLVDCLQKPRSVLLVYPDPPSNHPPRDHIDFA
jgi:hypothetical protein